MSENETTQGTCACNRVEYKPIDNGDGTMSEKWVCVTFRGCGQEFVRKAQLTQFRQLAEMIIVQLTGLVDPPSNGGRER